MTFKASLDKDIHDDFKQAVETYTVARCLHFPTIFLLTKLFLLLLEEERLCFTSTNLLLFYWVFFCKREADLQSCIHTALQDLEGPHLDCNISNFWIMYKQRALSDRTDQKKCWCRVCRSTHPPDVINSLTKTFHHRYEISTSARIIATQWSLIRW